MDEDYIKSIVQLEVDRLLLEKVKAGPIDEITRSAIQDIARSNYSDYLVREALERNVQAVVNRYRWVATVAFSLSIGFLIATAGFLGYESWKLGDALEENQTRISAQKDLFDKELVEVYSQKESLKKEYDVVKALTDQYKRELGELEKKSNGFEATTEGYKTVLDKTENLIAKEQSAASRYVGFLSEQMEKFSNYDGIIEKKLRDSDVLKKYTEERKETLDLEIEQLLENQKSKVKALENSSEVIAVVSSAKSILANPPEVKKNEIRLPENSIGKNQTMFVSSLDKVLYMRLDFEQGFYNSKMDVFTSSSGMKRSEKKPYQKNNDIKEGGYFILYYRLGDSEEEEHVFGDSNKARYTYNLDVGSGKNLRIEFVPTHTSNFDQETKTYLTKVEDV